MNIKTNENIKIWNNISFKTQMYRKNYDLLAHNENIITDYTGTISNLRIVQHKPPYIIGEYSYTIFNIETAKLLDADVHKLFSTYSTDDIYSELTKIIGLGLLDVYKYSKVVLIHSLMLHPDYRKHQISEEFIESIYRDHYDDKTLILTLAKPFQHNETDAEYYLKHRSVEVREKVREPSIYIQSNEYYGLDELINDKDSETITYKIYGVANRCGFDRLGSSDLFKYNPFKTINRIMIKQNLNSYISNIQNDL